MSRSRPLLMRLFAAAFVATTIAGGGVMLAQSSMGVNTPSVADVVPEMVPTAVPGRPLVPLIKDPPGDTQSTWRPLRLEGVPAIRPRITPPDRNTPAFTAQDAVDYVTKYSGSGRVASQEPVTVTKVEFLRASEVAARYHRMQSDPDDGLVCVVTMRGTFQRSTPRGGIVTGNDLVTFFDAETGNRLGLQMP